MVTVMGRKGRGVHWKAVLATLVDSIRHNPTDIVASFGLQPFMNRILLTLASLSLILLAAALVVGLSIGDLYHDPTVVTLHSATVHRLTGTAAALGVVFVESVIATYFIGTGRWCKEVAETYGLDLAPVRTSNRLKRRAFAWSLLGMLTIVGVISLGAAADPATGRPNTQFWTNYHFAGAFGGLLLVAWTYVAAWNLICANQRVIEEIAAKVAGIRRDRGLDDEPKSIEEHAKAAL
jgi:hypothetical protein